MSCKNLDPELVDLLDPGLSDASVRVLLHPIAAMGGIPARSALLRPSSQSREPGVFTALANDPSPSVVRISRLRSLSMRSAGMPMASAMRTMR